MKKKWTYRAEFWEKQPWVSSVIDLHFALATENPSDALLLILKQAKNDNLGTIKNFSGPNGHIFSD